MNRMSKITKTQIQHQFQAFQSRIITLSVYFTLLRENNEKNTEILNL